MVCCTLSGASTLPYRRISRKQTGKLNTESEIVTFNVTATRQIAVKSGFGTYFLTIWHYLEETEEPTSVESVIPYLAEINEQTVHDTGGVPCVDAIQIDGADRISVPVENFRSLDDLSWDDTHDLRTRWFATKEEATEHIAYTMKRWKNPTAWESFIQLDKG